ncbi:MAG: hypothetical protein AAF298_20185 [Cyanobacteria bacterium P01_A01_bin.40]
MFDLVIELHLYDIKEVIDRFSTANITINGNYGSLNSKKNKPPFQDMMIFFSIVDPQHSLEHLG